MRVNNRKYNVTSLSVSVVKSFDQGGRDLVNYSTFNIINANTII